MLRVCHRAHCHTSDGFAAFKMRLTSTLIQRSVSTESSEVLGALRATKLLSLRPFAGSMTQEQIRLVGGLVDV